MAALPRRDEAVNFSYGFGIKHRHGGFSVPTWIVRLSTIVTMQTAQTDPTNAAARGVAEFEFLFRWFNDKDFEQLFPHKAV